MIAKRGQEFQGGIKERGLAGADVQSVHVWGVAASRTAVATTLRAIKGAEGNDRGKKRVRCACSQAASPERDPKTPMRGLMTG